MLEKKGFNVVGVDINPSYCEKVVFLLFFLCSVVIRRFQQINSRTLASPEPRVEEFLKSCKNLKATTSLEEGIKHSDVLFILVDTPSTGGERHYDHSKLGAVLQGINRHKVILAAATTDC